MTRLLYRLITMSALVFLLEMLSVGLTVLLNRASEYGIREVAFGSKAAGFLPTMFLDTTDAIVAIASVFFVATIYVRLSGSIEERTVLEFENKSSVSKILLGLAVGTSLVVTSILVVSALGYADVHYAGALKYSSDTVLPVLGAPVFEEILSRGVIFRITEQMFGSAIALAISSLFFGFAHFGNPGVTLQAQLGIAAGSGLLFGLAYILTRSLWLPIGMHAGWNFAEGDLLGCLDSGYPVQGLFETRMHGNALVTGGSFGPEASLISLGLCLLCSLILLSHVREKGLWQPMKIRLYANPA